MELVVALLPLVDLLVGVEDVHLDNLLVLLLLEQPVIILYQ